MSTENVVDSSLKLLGLEGEDKITGFQGVIQTVGFDLYGCVQVVLMPAADKDGKLREGAWFDLKRIEVSENRVMTEPSFGRTPRGAEIGAAEKPLPPR